MKNKKKIVLSSALVLSLAIPIAASAATTTVGTFSFNFAYTLKGKSDYTLKNKATSITSKGNSYYASGKPSEYDEKYTVALAKGYFSSTSAQFKADGVSVNKSYGTQSAGTYNLNLTKNTSHSYADYVQGSGSIKQTSN